MQVTVFADYEQFYLQDFEAHDAAMRAGAATDPDREPGGWTHEAVHQHRIGLEPHSISVGTARIDFVETTLTVHQAAPALVPAAEHVVDADLDVVTGAVSVVGGAEPIRALKIEPGRYRVRVSYVPGSPPPDHFTYLIDMWPSGPPEPLIVRRQGPSPWG